MGLPPFEPPLDAVDFIAKGHLGTPCPKPREGGMCGCDEDEPEGPQDCYRAAAPADIHESICPLTC